MHTARYLLPRRRKFELGLIKLSATVASSIPLEEVQMALARHCRGRWTNLPPDDQTRNNMAVELGTDWIFSVYRAEAGTLLYVVTRDDRKCTKIALASEF